MTKPVLFYTTVFRCANCHAWYCRLPNYMDELDKGDCCEKCGCTSMSLSKGRPIGEKSKDWDWILENWEGEMSGYKNLPEDERNDGYYEILLASVAFPSNTACTGLA